MWAPLKALSAHLCSQSSSDVKVTPSLAALMGQGGIWLSQTPPQGSLTSSTQISPLLCRSTNPSSPCRPSVMPIYLCPFVLKTLALLTECHCSAPFHLLTTCTLVQGTGSSPWTLLQMGCLFPCHYAVLTAFCSIHMLSVGGP